MEETQAEPLSMCEQRSGRSGELDREPPLELQFDVAEGLALSLHEALWLRGISNRMQFDVGSKRWIIRTDRAHHLDARVVLLSLMKKRR